MLKERIGRKNFLVYAYDIETHADEESVRLKQTGVWLSSFINDDSKPDDENNYFYSINSWIEKLHEMTSKKKRIKNKRPCNNILIYIWNMAFEYSFILPVLLKDYGFQWRESIGADDEFCFSSITTKTCSSVWEVKLKFDKDGGIVILRDLMKIFLGSLRQVASSMGLETQKGDIDYRLNRRPEHWGGKYIPTKEEKLYNFNDTRIIIEILLKMKESGDREFWSSMSAASYSLKKMLKAAYPRSYRPYKEFRKRYPALGHDENEFLRNSVSGGLTYAPDNWQFKNITGSIKHIDFHSSHPSRMASMHHERFPYGKGTYGKGEPPHNPFRMYCCHVRASYTGVDLHSVIKLIGINCIDGIELTLWDFEIGLMYETYKDLEIEYIDYYEYRCSRLPFRNYFLEMYEKRKKAAAEGNYFEKYRLKIMINSAYGKFLERPHDHALENYINDKGLIDSVERPLEKKDHRDLDNAKYTYVPVGSCVAAWSRYYLIHDALTYLKGENGLARDNVLYMDTDSIFYLDNEYTRNGGILSLIGDKLGDFAFEDDLQAAQFTAPKRYKLLHVDGSTEVKMAGVTLKDNLIYDKINIVKALYSAHSRERVEGGTLILDKEKLIDVQPKYRAIYERNTNG